MTSVPGQTHIFHKHGTRNWTLQPEVLEEIAKTVTPGMSTLETGCGASTVAFSAAGANHVCVTPSREETERVQAVIDAEALPGSVRFAIGPSQEVLPGETGAVSMVLIDGGHGFPLPAVDWLYTAPRLDVGGTVIIDDVDLWTGTMLVSFLKEEPGWELVAIRRGRTAIFTKTAPFALNEWDRQPFVHRRSIWPQRLRKTRNAAALIATGQFRSFMAKLAHERAANKKTPPENSD